jgi:hypothetical protein
MVNGKPGDHPYTDMVGHGLDWGEPEIAARLRKINAAVDLDVKNLLADLVAGFLYKPEGLPDDYSRQTLLGHLDTIERLCAGRPARRRMRKRTSWLKTKKKKKTKTKAKKMRTKRARR